MRPLPNSNAAAGGGGLPMNLSPSDLQMFARLGISAELLDRAGVVRVTDAEAREKYGISGHGDMAGIIFP